MKLFEIFGMFKLDDGNVDEKLKDIDEEAKKTSKSLKDVGDTVTKAGGKLQDFGSKLTDIGGSMSAKFTVPIVAAVTTAIASTQEYREEMAKLDTAFEVNGRSVEDARESYAELYRVIGDEGVAVEASQQLAALTDNQKELNEWTNILAGVYGTFGDALPIEGLAEAANETAKTGSLTGGLADALNWAGESEELFQEKLESLNGEQERSQFILETMNGLYSEAGEKYKENSESIMNQRDAQLRLTEATAEFAETILPVVTDFINVLAGLIERFNDLDEGTQQFIISAGMILVAIGPVLMAFGSIVNGIGSIITFGGKLIGSWGTIKAAASVLAGGLTTILGVVFSPVGLIVLGITAVIAAGVALWKNWDKIKEFAGKLKDGLVNTWNKLAESTKEAFGNIKSFGSDMVEGLNKRWNSLSDESKETFKRMAKNMLFPITGLYDSIKKIVERIKKAFKFEIKFPKIKAPKWLAKVIPSLDDDGPEASPAGSTGRAGGSKVGKRFFAKGGYVNKSTEFARVGGVSHIAGEAGGEGIVPLEGKHMIPFAEAVGQVVNNGRNNETTDNSSPTSTYIKSISSVLASISSQMVSGALSLKAINLSAFEQLKMTTVASNNAAYVEKSIVSFRNEQSSQSDSIIKALNDIYGQLGQVNTEINVAELVVREEADVRKIAEELERLTGQKRRLRGGS